MKLEDCFGNRVVRCRLLTVEEVFILDDKIALKYTFNRSYKSGYVEVGFC